ncbi:hypothetical protein I7X13_01605 [Hymenobacter sp. BT442]|uniref:Integrase n=2 Tax=Hymenobacter negativus TaxID=2795026 RepID=A0ABS0Q271_9BACT|nr:hypothetical protein [Hymenobacter negativus]
MLKADNGAELTRATGVSCLPAHFNQSQGKLNSKDKLCVEKNEVIQALVRDFEAAARRVAIEGHEITKAALEAALVAEANLKAKNQELAQKLESDSQQKFIPNLKKVVAGLREELAHQEAKLGYFQSIDSEESVTRPRDLFTARIDEFIRVSPVAHKRPSTKNSYIYLRQTIERFNRYLQIQDINLATMNALQNWLLETPILTVKKQTLRRNSSVRNILIHTKAVFMWFADDLRLPTAFFRKFKMVDDNANENHVYLTAKELEEFASHPLRADAELLERARDQFILLCSTGLRHIDGVVTKADVFDAQDDKGNHYKELRLHQQKTSKWVNIPLMPRALEVLERNNYQLKAIKNNHFNQALKQIAKKIPSLQHIHTQMNYNKSEAIPDSRPKWEFISTKCGRKTFTDWCFTNDVSETTVAEWLGHKSTMMVQQHYKAKGDIAKKEAHKILFKQPA